MTDLSDILRMADASADLAEEMGLQSCDGGYRVKETETHYIEVVRMIFNWRLAHDTQALAHDLRPRLVLRRDRAALVHGRRPRCDGLGRCRRQ